MKKYFTLLVVLLMLTVTKTEAQNSFSVTVHGDYSEEGLVVIESENGKLGFMDEEW